MLDTSYGNYLVPGYLTLIFFLSGVDPTKEQWGQIADLVERNRNSCSCLLWIFCTEFCKIADSSWFSELFFGAFSSVIFKPLWNSSSCVNVLKRGFFSPRRVSKTLFYWRVCEERFSGPQPIVWSGFSQIFQSQIRIWNISFRSAHYPHFGPDPQLVLWIRKYFFLICRGSVILNCGPQLMTDPLDLDPDSQNCPHPWSFLIQKPVICWLCLPLQRRRQFLFSGRSCSPSSTAPTRASPLAPWTLMPGQSGPSLCACA